MIFAKTANESTFFSVFYHRLKFWTLKFNAPWHLQKTFAPHGFLFNNVYLHVYYHLSTFVGLVAKHPVLLKLLATEHLQQYRWICKWIGGIPAKTFRAIIEVLLCALIISSLKSNSISIPDLLSVSYLLIYHCTVPYFQDVISEYSIVESQRLP